MEGERKGSTELFEDESVGEIGDQVKISHQKSHILMENKDNKVHGEVDLAGKIINPGTSLERGSVFVCGWCLCSCQGRVAPGGI